MNPEGRPPITLDDLPDGWAKSVLAMYAKGCADIQVAVALGISRNTFTALLDREPEFLNTVQRGRDMAEAWWLEQGRAGVWQEPDGRRINHALYALHMRNRFGWNEKKEDQGQQGNELRIIVETKAPEPKE
jgi:hypothetical protein